MTTSTTAKSDVIWSTIDEAYFHIENGGITIKTEQSDGEYTSYRLSVAVSSFGHTITSVIDLPNENVMTWLIPVLGRILGRMTTDKPSSFADDCPEAAEIKYLDGKEVDLPDPKPAVETSEMAKTVLARFLAKR